MSTFSLPFRERTGIRGFSTGSFSSSSCMMCFFLDLKGVLTGGSSSSFSGSSSSSVRELSVADLTSSSLGWSDWSLASIFTSARSSAVASFSGSSVSVASSLTSAGASAVDVLKLYRWSSELGKFQWLLFIYTTNWYRWFSKCCK